METLPPDPSPKTLVDVSPAIAAVYPAADAVDSALGGGSPKTLASDGGKDTKTLDCGEDTKTLDCGEDTKTLDCGEDTKTLDFGEDTKPLDFGELVAKTLDFGESGDGDIKDGIFGRFVAGDLVWGRLKGKQWWPGMIVDPAGVADDVKDAGGEAKDGEALLVLYFGGSGFEWCDVSQLKHFVWEFDKMGKQSKSKNFVEAVNDAVEEARRFAERELACECVPVEDRVVSGEGLVGRVGEETWKTMEILKLLRNAACDVRAVNSVEIALLKSWVIRFGMAWSNDLLGFQKRRGIEELIDKIDLDVPLGELGAGGDSKKEKPNMSNDKLKKGSGSVKKKSMTKLIAELDLDTVEVSDVDDMKVEEEKKGLKRSGKRKSLADNEKDLGVEGSGGAKVEEESVSGKRKPVADNGKDLGVEDSGGVKIEEESASGKRDRKKSKYLSPPYTNLVGRDISYLASTKSMDVKSESAKTEIEEDVTNELWKLESTTADCILLELRYTALDSLYVKRSKLAKTVGVFFTKYRRSIYSSGSDFVKCPKEQTKSCPEELKSPIAGQGKSGANNSKRKNPSKDNEAGFSPDSANLSQKSKASRKKMTGNEAEGKNSKVTDAQIVNVPVVSTYDNNNSKDRDHTVNAVLFPEPINSCEPAKGVEEVLKDKEIFNCGSDGAHGSSDRSRVGKSGPKKKKVAVASSDTQMLGQILITNESEEVLKSEENSNGISAVVLGSSVCSRVGKSGPKKKKAAVGLSDVQIHLGEIQCSNEGQEVLKSKSMSNGGSDVVHGSSGRSQAGKRGRKKKAAVAASNGAPVNMDQIQKTNEDGIENRHPGALLMNFSAGVCFPSRDELISTFRKYGVVIESETEMQKESGFARIVFAKSTDAEKAYNSSDKSGIFCPSHVTYRLRYLPPITSSPQLATTPQKPPLPFIRENLERMISTLTTAASPLKNVNPSEGLKSETNENLVSDMEGLLKKVNMMLNGHSAGTSS